jgi:hypothetical protein
MVFFILFPQNVSYCLQTPTDNSQGGWTEPWDPEDRDVGVAERKLGLAISWFGGPVYVGKYPDSMWSFLDNFECAEAYATPFGVTYHTRTTSSSLWSRSRFCAYLSR